MNSFAVWRGYLNGLKILPVGFLILGLMMLFSGEPVVEGSIILDNCFRLSLFIGGFIAGINAAKSGCLHGSAVGAGLWLSKVLLFLWLFPEVLNISDLLISAIVCFLLSALGGLCGVNWLILKRREKATSRF
ncbi:MAG: TIGR04086 family membrane protein [Desulfitobacteriaceae bacterium]|nr:TIGR04086 family membrane protein [Desulfitobacteriaceae bacterium]